MVGYVMLVGVIVKQYEGPGLWPCERFNSGHHDDQDWLGLPVLVWAPQKQMPR